MCIILPQRGIAIALFNSGIVRIKRSQNARGMTCIQVDSSQREARQFCLLTGFDIAIQGVKKYYRELQEQVEQQVS